MTDKASKYPEDFGDGEEYQYHIGKKEKIMICAFIGFSILAVYYYLQIQNDLKNTDWTLDPNTNWTCHSLTSYQTMVERTLQTGNFPFPRQLEQQINDKRMELNCK